jgi:hypothetical protein
MHLMYTDNVVTDEVGNILSTGSKTVRVSPFNQLAAAEYAAASASTTAKKSGSLSKTGSGSTGIAGSSSSVSAGAIATNTGNGAYCGHHTGDWPNTWKHNHKHPPEWLMTHSDVVYSRFRFVTSPIGNGYDCSRTWVILFMGAYPIVKSQSGLDSM